MTDPAGWEWDRTLYAGAARHYASGRMPYPARLASALRSELGLDGTARLLDLGCGPGSLTLLLAPLFESVTGVDGSSGMIAAARSRAARAGVTHASWLQLRAEEISPALGMFRMVTFAQSFHWLNRPLVARHVVEVLEPDGACVIVYATTHQGVRSGGSQPAPRPPWDEIDSLVALYLGSTRRAGRGTRPRRDQPGDGTAVADAALADDAVLAAAGLRGPVTIDVAAGPPVMRSEDEIVAAVFSLSYASPSLFGARAAEFEQDLRALLRRASAGGRFCEQPRAIRLEVWRPARSAPARSD